MNVSYERQTFDHPNPLARFAHRTRLRRSKEIVKQCLADCPQAVVVDYGCGQGRFLHALREETGAAGGGKIQLFGYDPYMASEFDGYVIVSDLAAIPDRAVEMITCLEVCEHLENSELNDFMNFIRTKLRPNGWLLVTVPVMIGPSVLVKEFSRMLLFRRWTDTSLKELWLAAIKGVPPKRAADIKTSHRGYDWRATLAFLKKELKVEWVKFSPLPWASWYVNSQALMLFRNCAATAEPILEGK
jgi:SAM-dependent methyltransferase